MARTTMKTPGVEDAVFARLRRLQPAAVRRWGSMSVEGMLWHLDRAYGAVLQPGALRPHGNAWLGRALVRPVALHWPLRWARGLPTVPELDLLRGAGSPAAFAVELGNVERSMARFLAHKALDGLPHPIFGPLTEWEWMRWAWRHTDHHLRQFSA